MSKRIQVGECPVDVFDLLGLSAHLQAAVQGRRKCLISGVNALMYVKLHEDPEYRGLIGRMDVVTSDGFWLARAARALGLGKVEHVAIVSLVHRFLGDLAGKGGKVFLLGTKPELVLRAGDEMLRRFPGIQLAGVRDGFFGKPDEPAIADEINASGADVLLVGISTPKRERWMIEQREALDAPVVIGVGGLLDIWAGATAEGPAWLRKFGLMWVFRLCAEPRRMWKRYLVGNTRFIYLMVCEWLRSRHRQPEAPGVDAGADTRNGSRGV